jgi:amino acid permease
MRSKLFGATAILIGTIIGAGIFGIPYVVSKAGFAVGVFYIFFLGLAVFITTLCYGEVILRTKEPYQMSGYAEKYLGTLGKRALSFSLIFGIYGALLAYMIGVGDFANALLSASLGGTPFLYTAIFFVLGSLIVFFGLKTVARFEKIMVLILILIVALIFVFGVANVRIENLTGFNAAYLFLPYGVILFAFTGATAVVDMRKTLAGEEKKLKKAIFIGHLIPLIVYLIFAFIVCGVAGKETSPEAIIGLSKFLGPKIFSLGALLGILTMSTSFLTLGLALKEIFMVDYKINKTTSWVLACFVPFIIFLLGLTSFIKIIGIVGAVTGGINGIIILLMYLKAKEKGEQTPAFSVKLPKSIIYISYLIFGLGILYQVYYSFWI